MGQTGKIVDRVIEAGITGLLLFAPLPLGSVLPWAQGIIEGTVALLLALWAARMLASGEVTVRWTPLLWPGLALAVVIGLQLRLPVVGSINPYATWESLRLYLAYLGFLLLLGGHLGTKARIVRLLSILVGWGVLLALLGLANRMTGHMLLPWFPLAKPVTRLTATFVNPNHQALYFAILFFLALGLVLRPRARSSASRVEASASDRRRSLKGGELAGRLLLVGALAVIGAALALTLSRGAFVGFLVGLLVVVALSLYGRVGSVTILAVAAALAVVVAFASWFDLEPILERVAITAKEPFADARWSVYGRTIEVLRDAPVLGVGLGAFQDAFPLHRPASLPSEKYLDHAHNDYLEFGAETGIVGLLVLAWAVIGLMTFVVRRWTLRHDPFVRGLALGGLGAAGAVAAHSALDFGLHMPANALLTVLLVALLPLLVALRTRVGSGDGVDLPAWSWRVTPRLRVAGLVALGAGVVGVGFAVAPPAVADWQLQRAAAVAGEARRAEGGVTMGDLTSALADLEAAARLDPRNARIQNARAEVAEELARRVWIFGVEPNGRRIAGSLDARVGTSQGFFATAYVAYERSLAENPRAAWIHARFARFLLTLEGVRQTIRGSSTLRTSVDPRLAALVDSGDSLTPRALTHLREAIRWNPESPFGHRDLALFALAQLKGDQARQVAAEEFRQALTMEPALLGAIVSVLESRGADWDLVRASLPRRGDVWLAYAKRLDTQGRRDRAAPAFEEALTLTSEATGQAAIRVAFAGSLLRGGNARAALDQARRALVLAPKRHEVFGTLAEIYGALKEWKEAEAALASAITLAGSPGGPTAHAYRDRLASFYLGRGQVEQALALRQQMVRDVPNDAYERFHLARLLEQHGEWTEAFREYRTIEGLAPSHAGLRAEAARAYARNGLLREAAASYEAAIRLAPSQSELRVELAQLYARLNSSAVQPAATTGR